MNAGDVVFFTEGLTHCTIPWRGQIDRLTLLYKYSPGHSTWSTEDNDAALLAPLLTERQRRLLQPPSVYGHRPVNG